MKVTYLKIMGVGRNEREAGERREKREGEEGQD